MINLSTTLPNTHAIDNLWHYLNSWRNEHCLFGHAVSYWEWAPAVVAPHSMHAWPIMFGLLEIHARNNNSEALKEAIKLGRWYIEDCTPQDSGLSWAGGETPRKKTGDILQSAPILALAQLAKYDPSGPWMERAEQLRQVVLDRFWDGCTVSYVGNHAAYMLAAESLIESNGGKPANRQREESMLRRLSDTIYRRGAFQGAVAQADFDPRVFDIYVGKALFGLGVYSLNRNSKATKEILRTTSNYLRRRVELLEHQDFRGFSNWRPRMSHSRIWGGMRRINRRITGNILRKYVERLQHWDRYGPLWVARGALVSMGLRMAARVLECEHCHEAANRVDHWLTQKQDLTGGLRNSYGFMGDYSGPDLWQDVMRPVRWNSYVFAAWAMNADFDSWNPTTEPLTERQFHVTVPVHGHCGVGEVIETPDHIEFRNIFPESIQVSKKAVSLDYSYCGGNAQRPEYARNWIPSTKTA